MERREEAREASGEVLRARHARPRSLAPLPGWLLFACFSETATRLLELERSSRAVWVVLSLLFANLIKLEVDRVSQHPGATSEDVKTTRPALWCAAPRLGARGGR